MAHRPGPGRRPLLARVLVVPLRPSWWLPTRWQRGERHTLAMHTSSDPNSRARQARAALAAFQAAERRATTGGRTLRRQRRRAAAHLPSMAAAALEAGELEAAAGYAQQMLDAGMGPSGPGDWNAGNLIHHGHITLGRLALLAGDTDGAAQHLLAAGSTRGSPQLDAFGPDLHLANQLLDHDQTDTVMDYLRRCRQFWKLGGDKLQQWITEIQAGHRPTLDP